MLLKNVRVATIAVIITTTTGLFSGLLYREYVQLKQYTKYITEHATSDLFYEEDINQRLAFSLSTAFSIAPHALQGLRNSDSVCHHLEYINGVYGLNLTGNTVSVIDGTLQTKESDCMRWSNDISDEIYRFLLLLLTVTS